MSKEKTILIATKLFGWTPCAAPVPEISEPSVSWFTHAATGDYIGVPARKGRPLVGTVPTPKEWPVFEGFGQRDWVRRMEDKLEEFGVFIEYSSKLIEAMKDVEGYASAPMYIRTKRADLTHCLDSTVAVIQEQGL